MKHCLITGGGSKFGSLLTNNFICTGYHVYLITSNPTSYIDNPNVTTIPVNWKNLNLLDIKQIVSLLPNLDLIFFNHNSSALSSNKFLKTQIQNPKDWQQNYFVACQFPFYLIHALKNHISGSTRIGWMLSTLIKNPVKNQIGFADYIGNKFTNACIMQAFSQQFPAIFFGIVPELVGNMVPQDIKTAEKIVNLIIHKSNMNGQIFFTNGEQFDF